MQSRKRLMTLVPVFCAMACGAADTTSRSAEPADSRSDTLTLPFPDDYFGMFLAREAGAAPNAAESCAAQLEKYTAAWSALQSRPEFTQLADTGAWQTAAGVRDGYAGQGCFTSGPLLSKPSKDCTPEFNKLVNAWHEVERMPQFTVLISGAANHDLYAAWVDAVALKCVLGS